MTFNEENIAEIYLKYSAGDYASMTPAQFEGFIAFILRFKFDKTEVVGASGDFGCDVLCQDKNGDKTAVQVKRYALDNKINNRVVNEVLGGMSYYGASKGIVITSGRVLDSAYKLANKDGRVEIWDKQMLDSFIRAALHDKLSNMPTEAESEDEVLKLTKISNVTHDELAKPRGHYAYFIEYIIENISSESIQVMRTTATVIAKGFRANANGWSDYDSSVTLQAGEKAKQGIVVNKTKVDSNLVVSPFEIDVKYNVTRRGHVGQILELKAERSKPKVEEQSLKPTSINSSSPEGNEGFWIALGVIITALLLGVIIAGSV
jgi:hypothetical protein